MIDQYYMNMQMKELVESGYIQFSNDELLPEYEAAMKQRRIDYKIVQGLGDYGLTIAICHTPERFQQFTKQLQREIEQAEQALTIKKAAQLSSRTN